MKKEDLFHKDLRANGLKVATLTLGCKVNQFETDAMEELLKKSGYEIVPFKDGDADIYLINTCSVTNVADRKSRQMLHRARKQNENAIIIAAGCYVQAAAEDILAKEDIDILIGNDQKNQIVEIIEAYKAYEDENYVSVLDLKQGKEFEEMTTTAPGEQTRAFIKIQDGCNQFCSYCIIPYLRGRIRSREKENIIEEITTLCKQGVQEVVLTGIHLSSYGVTQLSNDKGETNQALLSLIDDISKIEGLKRIRLGSLEPRIITKEFADRIAANEKVCPHFHLSLQSACNDTLKRMNRKYTIEEYMEKCELLRSVYDRPAITTDVIVGFPGETEEEFETTVLNLSKLKLYEMHIFKFSPRKGTVAYTMPDQVPEQIKTKRSDVLLKMTKKHQEEFEKSFKGEEVLVLFEEEVREHVYVGHTTRYMKVFYESYDNLENVIKRVIY